MFGFGTKAESISMKDFIDQKVKPIIDVREVNEYKAGHVPGAKNIPMMGLMTNADQFLNKDTKYYIICQSGGRSMQVVKHLTKQGYNVVNVEGGTGAYMMMK